MKLSDISIERPILVAMMNLGLVLFGIVGLLRLPVRELPDIDPPIINVQTVYPGASGAVIESQITEPLEDTLASVEGIKKLTSESREQLSSITIEFNLSQDIDVAAQDVRDRVGRVRGNLPEDIEEPIVSKQDANARPCLWVALYSERFSTLELTTLAENLFKDRLQTVPGVSSVILGGSKRFAIRLWLDSEKMAARGLTVLDVEKALKEQSVELPSGRIESFERELAIETRGQLKTPEEYNDLVVKQDGDILVRLRDIGEAKIGVEDERSVARYQGKPAVGIGVIKQSKSNIIDVAKGIKEELERIKPIAPEGLVFSIPYDESIYIDKAVHEVWETLFLAFLLVVGVIYVFLHNARATLIPTLTIPVSIVGTFAVLYFFGYSINIITMLAFVLAIGLVVDDAIVVLENIHRHIEEGLSPMEAAFKGMKEIGFAVIATTVALVAVFLPMAFQTSDTGRLFIEFAVAISFSVIISAFAALTLAPMASARVLKHSTQEKKKKGMLISFEKWLDKRRDDYGESLNWSLKHSGVILFFCGLIIAASIFLFLNLEREFLPEEDKGRLFCIAIAPEGSTSEYTDRMVRKMEKMIEATPEVEGFFSAVALSQGGPGQASQGLAFIRLKEHRERHVRDIVNGPTGLGGQFFGGIEGAFVIPIIPKAIDRSFSQPFLLVLQHPDLIELNRGAENISNQLRQAGFLTNVRSTFELNKPELRVNINRDRAAVLGVSVQDISRTLQILFGGLDLARLNLEGKEYDVIAQLSRQSRLSPDDLEKIYIRNTSGNLVQLNNVIDYETGGGASSINHFNRIRSATIEATPVNMPLGTAMQKTVEILKKELPEGFRYEWNGEASNLQEAGSETIFVLILAILIIYMVLAAQFESLINPLVIMMTVPLAVFGAFLGLWIFAQVDKFAVSGMFGHFLPRIPAMGINLFSQIGLVMLIGIITKNGILLVEFADQEMDRGKNPVDAMLAAGKVRFRPILMTAVSTIAGILPIAIGFGAGAESRRPLGIAAASGVAVGTLLTFFVIPVVYVLLNRRRARKEKKVFATTVMRFFMLFALLFNSSGCVIVGDNYSRPALDIPADWENHKPSKDWKTATPNEALPKGEWWKIFDDETLNRLQELALNNNHNLKSAMANVEEARAIARVSRSALLPRFNLNPVVTTNRTTKSAIVDESFGGTSNRFEEYSFPLDLSYEIDLWGRVRRAFEASRADAEADVADYQNVLLTLTSDIATNYFLMRELDKEIEILDSAIKLRQEAHEIVSNRVKGGVSNELDFRRAEAELASAKARRVGVVRRRYELENALAVLSGQLPSEFMISPRPFDLKAPQIPNVLPSSLLERRPDIALAERTVIAANARIGVAEAAFFPSVNLIGTAGYKTVQLENLFDWESRYWSLGPSITVPLFTGGRGRANLQAARAKYESTLEMYRQTVLQAFGDVETALSNFQHREEENIANRETWKAAKKTAELSMFRYTQGLVTFLEVVDAERTRLDAELQVAQITNEQLLSAVQLIKAIGGSWDPPEEPTT